MKKILLLIVALLMGLAAFFFVLQQTKNEQGERLSPDALAVRLIVQKYCEADFQGATLSTDSYIKSGIDKFIIPGEHAPYGWDTATLVEKYNITTIEVSSEKANVKVKYDSLGELTPERFKMNKQVEEFIYKLIKKDGEWKLIDPCDLQPHISIDTAINHLQLLYDENKEAQTKAPKIISELRDLKSSEGGRR